MVKFALVFLCVLLTGTHSTDPKDNTSCDRNVTTLNNEAVSPETYCKDRPCLIKCCGENEVLLGRKRRCSNIEELNKEKLKNSTIKTDLSDLYIYESDIENGIRKTNMTFGNFTILKDTSFVDNKECTPRTQWLDQFPSYMLENGNFAGHLPDQLSPRLIQRSLTFCIDLNIRLINNYSTYSSHYAYYFIEETTDNKPHGMFATVAFLISAFCLLLVLVVYSVLPQLRNLSGMLLMVYAATMCLTFGFKAFMLINENATTIGTCLITTPILLFLYISSFLWLNVMSFDIWWMCRGMQLRRKVNRRGGLVKFLWYCLFVWGFTGLMILLAVWADNSDLQIIKPQFITCFNDQTANRLYINTPVGILTLVNIIFFLMTIYNMWASNKLLKDFQSNKNNQIRFRLYIKLSLLMGVSWVVEIAETFYNERRTSIWIYILLNFYNFLIGVPIFCVFICNKPVFRMLCLRFNIKSNLFDNVTLNSNKTRFSSSRPTECSYAKANSVGQTVDMSEFSDTDATETRL